MPPLQCIAFMGLNACPELLATPQVCDTYDRTSVKWVTQGALYFLKKYSLGKFWINGLNVLSFLRPLPMKPSTQQNLC